MAEITEDGKLTGLNKVKPKIICPTCKGVGKINKPYPPGTALWVSEWPKIICQTCNGEKWIYPEVARELEGLIK